MPIPGKLLPTLPLRRRGVAVPLHGFVALPAPPGAANWSNGQTDWGMLGNDRVGDCVEAAMLHAVELTSNLTSAEASFVDADALALYTTLGGYNGSAASDRGTDPTVAVDYWEQIGIAGMRALAAGECANVKADYQAAIAYLGFAFFTFNVPASMMQQFAANETWDIVPNDGGIVGAHEVLLVGYDSQTVALITWGRLWLATWEFILRYAILTYGVVLPEWIGQNGESPSGLTPEQLVIDSGELGSPPEPSPPEPPPPPTPPKPNGAAGLPDPGTGVHLWADVSAPPPDVATLCLLVNALRLDGFIVRCNDRTIWQAWDTALRAAETRLQKFIGLGAYLDVSVAFPSEWPTLIEAVSAWVKNPEEFRLDLELDRPTQAQIVAAIQAAQAHYPGAGIYTSEGYWQGIGNPQVGGLCSLWLARWATPVSFSVWFGGWTRASKVQYQADLNASGLVLDLSAAEV